MERTSVKNNPTGTRRITANFASSATVHGVASTFANRRAAADQYMPISLDSRR